MELRINQKPAILGLKIHDSQVQIRQKPDAIQLKADSAKLSIKHRDARMSVDYSPCDEAIGYYEIGRFSKKAAADGEEAAAKGIDRIVSEGNQMEDVHKNGIIISRLATRDAWVERNEIEVAPKPGPNVTWDKSSLMVKAQEKNVKLAVSRGNFQSQANPAEIQAYLKQAPEFDIEYVGNNIDTFR